MNKTQKTFFLTLLSACCILFFSCQKENTQTIVSELRCEYLDNPLGLDVPAPRFTWNFDSDEKGFLQESYRIRVASSPEILEKGEADIWDSGKISSSDAYAVYSGKTLEPHKKYFWTVSVWDGNGYRCAGSPVASFETAKMNKGDWKAQWITDNHDKEFEPAPLFRKEFPVGKKVEKARAYVSGTGYYELFVNGSRVGENYLDPGYTDFGKRILYVTHDITPLLTEGKNAVAAVLGNGWANVQSRAVWNFDTASWRARPRLLCELRINYTDGTTETIASDTSWQTNSGPYIYNNIYSGDRYDARLEEPGWKNASFDASSWKKAIAAKDPAPILCAQLMPAIRIVREITPVSVKTFDKQNYVFDIGENIAGSCRLKVKGEAGTRISLRHGELLKKDGHLEQGNINYYYAPVKPGEVFQEDIFILKGTGEEEIFMPAFTYHGFQYVEINSSKPIELTKESLSGLFMHTDLERVGNFSCSNELLNKIHSATMQSYTGNIHSIPTDCPQREKNGWTADAHAAIDLALLNFDGITFYEKWINDIIDNQSNDGSICGIIPSYGWGGGTTGPGPVWDAVMFIIPNALYNYYGDINAIKKIYPTCEKYLSYMQTREKDGIIDFGLGDWLPYRSITPNDFTSSAYYYLDYVTMSRFATLLGKDATPYKAKAEKLKTLINKKFFNPETGIYANGTQTALALALYTGIVPEGKESLVAGKLHETVASNDYFLDFGLLGSKTVPAMLTKYGYVEDAMKMVTKTEAPSWGYFVETMGQSTLSETWTLHPKFNDGSLNHVFFGDVAAWMTNSLAGINFDTEQPGFRHIVIRPYFVDELDWVKGELQSVNGLIRSEWKRDGSKIVLTVTVPANTTASVYADKLHVVKSGTHTFTIE